MPNFIDCQYCSTEILVSSDIIEQDVRCPDCLQWIDNQHSATVSIKNYYGSSLQLTRQLSGYDSQDYDYDC